MAIDLEAEIGTAELREFIEQGAAAITTAISLTATDVWGNVMREAPTDHGRLAGSFIITGAGLEYSISTSVLYALFVHEGTGIHGPIGQPIVPDTAKALRFEVGGDVIFARSVEGIEPNPYGDRAIDNVEPKVGDFIQQALEMAGVS